VTKGEFDCDEERLKYLRNFILKLPSRQVHWIILMLTSSKCFELLFLSCEVIQGNF
jgi:hypothetical protein